MRKIRYWFTLGVVLFGAWASLMAQSVLKTAGNFTLLGGTAVTSDGTAGTVISGGNVGSAVAVTGFHDMNGGAGPAEVTPPFVVIVGGGVVNQALLDLGQVQVGLAGMPSNVTMSNVDLGGKTLIPGVYTFGGAAALNGALVLDAQGQNNVFWVFQIGTTLTTGGGSSVTLINPGTNGGSDVGVFWAAGAGINFGSGNTILGNYLAGTTISSTTGTHGSARALSQAGVTLINDQFDSYGGPSASDWTGALVYNLAGNIVPIVLPPPPPPPPGPVVPLPLPEITSSTSLRAVVGVPFAYQIEATNEASAFYATNLPSGLVLNVTTGRISGTPLERQYRVVPVTAFNTTGWAWATLRLEVNLPDDFLAGKVSGWGVEVASNILHPNGNVYDQVLATGPRLSVTADSGQITRVSFVDLTNDIVQVEFSGAGTLAVELANASEPEVAVNYNQPNVSYVRGHLSVAITGANLTTNVAVFSVGKINAFDQTLFKFAVNYDGMADLACISIASIDGKFGGVYTGNAGYFAASGLVGISAPSVQFTGPVRVGDLNASDTASPVILLDGSVDVQVAGGDLFQTNGRAINVSGVSKVSLVAGTKSSGVGLPAQSNLARFEQDGVDVTDTLVKK